ncbi:MAG: hypothetical protein ACI9IP_001027 [Arcticibacterium sp.]|jgi:hypothetical protein
MSKEFDFTLGYADLVSELDHAPKRYRLASFLLNFTAGVSSYVIYQGLGEINSGLSSSLEILIPICHGLYFLMLIGKGSLDRGFHRMISLVTHLLEKFEEGLKRVVAALLPFIVNIAIICFIFPFIYIGLQILSNFPLTHIFLEKINVLHELGGATAIFAFFNEFVIVPYFLSAIAVTCNWLFFKENH